MKYYKNLKIKQLSDNIFVVDTNEKKYVFDNFSAQLAQINNKLDFDNPVHMDALSSKINIDREKKRVFTPSEYIKNKKLCRLMIYLTSGCNMRCIYCHCNSTFGENMSDEILYSALNKYYEHIKNRIDYIRKYEEIPQITFMGGGEPFLRIMKIKEVVEYFNKKCKVLNLIPRYVIVTNTTLGNDSDWEWLVKNNFMINLSLDGPNHIQNRNRPLYGNKPSAPLIEKRLNFLSAINADVHVRSTIIDTNEINDVCEYFKQFSCVKTHALEPVSLAGRAIDNLTSISPEHFYNNFFEIYSKHLFDEPNRFKSSWFSPFKRTEGFCGAVYCNAIVLPDGNITLCSEVDSKEKNKELKDSFIVSNINDQGDIFESNKALKFTNEHRLDNIKKCKHCIIKYKCGGGCYVKKARDFNNNEDEFYNSFCKSAISMNISFLIGLLEKREEQCSH